MLCLVAWFLACHTSGWIECIEHMQERLAPLTAQRSSTAEAAWPRLLRSPAAVGVLLAVLIALLAWPRLTGPSWRALAMPFDLRESEGHTLQWEQHLLFTALRATLQSDAAPMLERAYNTDHYRALLPTYVSAIFAYWLDSSYKGFALVDLLGWWIGSWSLYHLAQRLGTDRLSALIAAVLLATSPLVTAFMWQQAVHVAHSASLVPCFLVSLLLLADKRLAFGWRVVSLAGVLYIASLTYQYQWIIIPCLLSLAVVERRRWTWSLSIAAAAILFIGMTFLTYQTLGLVDQSVSSHSNDPLAVVVSQLAFAMEGNVSMLVRSLLRSVELLVKSYHPLIILLSVLGLIFARARLRILVCLGIVLGLASCYFQPVSWVAMNGYPFVYISAGLVLVQGPRWIADCVAQISSRRSPQFAEQIMSGSRVLARLSTVALMLLTMWSTNTDLLGEYGFTQQWLGYLAW